MVDFAAEHEAAARLVDRIGMQAAAIFTAAEERLLEQIARRVLRDLPEMPELGWQLKAMRHVARAAREAVDGIPADLAEQLIAEATRDGTAAMARQLVDFPTAPTAAALASVTQSAAVGAALIAADLGNAFADMRARILRYPRDLEGRFLVGGDVYQQVIANNAGASVLGVASTHEARKAALAEFLRRGVTGFTDVKGRNWRIGTYTEMATRTAVARAHREAGLIRSEGAGIELFTILGGRNSCESCAFWFGKIIARSGEKGLRDFPHATQPGTVRVFIEGSLDDWRRSGAGHPNCTCVLAAFAPGTRPASSQSFYDPAKHAARERSRELERRVRDEKRRLDIAGASEDQTVEQASRTRIRDLQAELRKHEAETGQRRRYEREQPRFSDGRTTN